ncbi:hypothetical protein CALVIDRAFT_36855 [Calocera viscosa TUFC12733]|uniref:Uncharacterized protein n=1 Tax=Calocera viscosa (strain TUFC12733) TaxID=1330018 RepID=A0A167NYK1_CALVF|nr:hypothetical protein CALVIDRAFT_36855 [Calocera viscosa TUFC12733]
MACHFGYPLDFRLRFPGRDYSFLLYFLLLTFDRLVCRLVFPSSPPPALALSLVFVKSRSFTRVTHSWTGREREIACSCCGCGCG